jgi:hypothetical protein
LDFLSLLDTLEESSVSGGILQIAYVKERIEGWGRDLALYIYSPKIVDRFIAPPPIEATALDTSTSAGSGYRGTKDVKFTITAAETPEHNVRPQAEKIPLSLSITQDEEEAPEETIAITVMTPKPIQDLEKSDTEEAEEGKKE